MAVLSTTGIQTLELGATGWRIILNNNWTLANGWFTTLWGAVNGLSTTNNGQVLQYNSATGVWSPCTITGTANQVNISNTNGTITFSLPQNIDTTATPTFANAKLTGVTGMLQGNGSSNIAAITGTANTVAKWTDSNTIGNSQIFDDGTNVGIGTNTPTGAKIVIQNAADGLPGLQIITTGTMPPASAIYRGAFFIQQGASGVADSVSVCLKSASDTYSWKLIIGG